MVSVGDEFVVSDETPPLLDGLGRWWAPIRVVGALGVEVDSELTGEVLRSTRTVVVVTLVGAATAFPFELREHAVDAWRCATSLRIFMLIGPSSSHRKNQPRSSSVASFSSSANNAYMPG